MIHAEPDGIHESLKGASLQNVTEITNRRGESPGHDIMSHGLLAKLMIFGISHGLLDI